MNLRRAALIGVVWSAIQRWGQQGLSVLVLIVLARLVEPRAFGIVAMAVVVLAFLQVLVDQGFESAIVQRKTDPDQRYLDTAFWFNAGVGLLFTTLSIAGSGIVAAVYGEPQLEEIIDWLSLILMFVALGSVQQGILRRRLAFKQLAVRSLAGAALGGAVGVAMAVGGFGVWSLVGQSVVTSLASLVLLWWLSDWRPGFSFSFKSLKELLGFGTPVLATSLVFVVNRQGDHVLIGYLLGAEALGFYTVARRLISAVDSLLNGVIIQVGLPLFSRIQEDHGRVRESFYKVTKLTSMISFPVFLGLAAVATELVPMVFGPQWIPSIPIMQILAFLGIVQCLVSWSGLVTMALGRPLWRLAAAAVNATTNLVVVAVFATWGVIAVAAAVVLRAYLLSPPIQYFILRKLIAIEPRAYLRQLYGPAAASGLMLLAVGAAKALSSSLGFAPGVTVLLAVGLGAATYAGVVAAVEPALASRIWKMRSAILPKHRTPFRRAGMARGVASTDES